MKHMKHWMTVLAAAMICSFAACGSSAESTAFTKSR